MEIKGRPIFNDIIHLLREIGPVVRVSLPETEASSRSLCEDGASGHTPDHLNTLHSILVDLLMYVMSRRAFESQVYDKNGAATYAKIKQQFKAKSAAIE